ncbi:hypothetical protein [Acinetobacter tjernbergiae]|uniref:Uncharacterized protein n=1 Tax=Acinetobacter tjernbergiae DSM 14971 = CIP 107465 TaxID=1120928 RepID=V2UTC8_9GAMM|nr:hypothetical protein [Acinetobacter tjernbergiae]ESK51851.1 hypothetical protein F990_03541 [Acinetobacter tjernbergiae DSM 14971 = CIP 107465]
MDLKGNKMKVLGIVLILLGIGFGILSIVLLIKAIFQIKELKNKDIKIEFKYSENKKKEDNS